MLIAPDSVFRAYDIRGIVDKDFDADWVELLGKACGTFFQDKGFDSAVIGHDCRASSPVYQERLMQGLLSTGTDVVRLDMVPSPVFYYAVKKLNRKAGVVITASHNPAPYNGFKIWAGESTIHTDDIAEIRSILDSRDFAVGSGVASAHDIRPSYLDELASQFSLKKPVKVVLDAGNGAGGPLGVELLRRMGAEVVPLYCEPDGAFPNHHPDPVIDRYMDDLKARVVAEKADVGIGLDGDADRIGIIDEQGVMVYGDKVLALFARDVLAANPGATVIGEVKCSHLMYRDIEDHGGVPLMWMAGHSMIKAKMRETGALLAGEVSGHFFFADRYYGFDDALYGAARFVELLAKQDKPVSGLLNDWPGTVNTPEIRVDCPEEKKFEIAEKAQQVFSKQYETYTVDGVRIMFPDGWALLRASNTQPALVLRFEAMTAARRDEIRREVEAALASIRAAV